MSWQDELQQLDSALASGQISADEYRTRRDRVIAQASGQSVQEPPLQELPATGGDPTQVFRPIQAQPQQPQQPQQGEDQADRTQIVSGTQGDRTQVVSTNADADRTQIVAGVPQPQFPPRQPPPPWETQQPQQPPPMTPPPWANEDLPPEFGQQSWPRQGPEVFEEKSGGGAGKIVAIVVAIVLVLGGGGAALWFLVLKDKGGNQAGGETTQTTAPKTTKAKPKPPDIPKGPFVDLPGKKKLNGIVPMQQAVTQKRPTEQEAQLLQSSGVSEVGMLVADDDDDGIRRGIWAFKVGDGADPQAVLNAMDQLYQAATYELASNDNGVLVRKLTPTTPDKTPVYRAHYLTKDGYMIRVEVYDPDATNGVDPANIDAAFNELLAQETDKFPPAGA